VGELTEDERPLDRGRDHRDGLAAMGAGHGDDEVGSSDQRRGQLPRGETAGVGTRVLDQGRHGWAHRVADQRRRPGARYVDPAQAGDPAARPVEVPSQQPLDRRRTTDIAGADDKDVEGHEGPFSRGSVGRLGLGSG
jgi:hypothetical protein